MSTTTSEENKIQALGSPVMVRGIMRMEIVLHGTRYTVFRLQEGTVWVNPAMPNKEDRRAVEEHARWYEWPAGAATVPAPRPTWDETFMAIAEVVSLRSTCNRLRVGSVVIRKNFVLTTGYNGAPRHLPHCIQDGCIMEGGHCVRAVHSEMNAILQAAFEGTSLLGGTMYTLGRPCVRCAGAIIQAGICRVVYREEYDSDGMKSSVEDMFRQSGISLEKVEVPGVTN